MGVDCEVLAGVSASRLDHPREFIWSLKDVDAMVLLFLVRGRCVWCSGLTEAETDGAG